MQPTSILVILLFSLGSFAQVPECATDSMERTWRFLDFTTLNVRLSVPGHISVVETSELVSYVTVAVRGTTETLPRVLVAKRENTTSVGDEISVTFAPTIETSSEQDSSTFQESSASQESSSGESFSQQSSVQQSSSIQGSSSVQESSSIQDSSAISSEGTQSSSWSTTGDVESSGSSLKYLSWLVSGTLFAHTRNPIFAALPLLASQVACQNDSSECIYVEITVFLPRHIASFVPIEINSTFHFPSPNVNETVYRFGFSKITSNYGICYNAGITGECVPTGMCTGRKTPATGLCRYDLKISVTTLGDLPRSNAAPTIGGRAP